MSTKNELVMVGFGKETFSTKSISLSAFDVRDGFERTLLSKKHKRRGAPQRFAASAYPDVSGYLYLDSVECPEGTIVCLQSTTRSKAVSMCDAAIFLRVRSEAPLHIIKAALPYDAAALQTGDFLVFQGRADIVPIGELEAYGIQVPKHFLNSFTNEDEIEEAFTIQELAPALAPAKKAEVVKTTDGDTVVVSGRALRRVRFR